MSNHIDEWIQFATQHLQPDEILGFKAHAADQAVADTKNPDLMRGWAIYWGFYDAACGQKPFFPFDPDYLAGRRLYALYSNHCQCNELDGNIVYDTQTIGWSVVSIEDRWFYTIGLYANFGQPDIALIGFNPQISYAFLQEQGIRVLMGETIQVNVLDHSVAQNLPAIFKPVDHSHYDKLFGTAIRFHGHSEFPMLQLCWCDRRGHFPWDAHYDSSMPKYPLLFNPA